jgi:CheY-like chemotaxis protein
MAVVLVVEDEDQVRVLAESYLEEQGHQVLSAGTPTGALAILQNSDSVDLLFTDLDLKGDISPISTSRAISTPASNWQKPQPSCSRD